MAADLLSLFCRISADGLSSVAFLFVGQMLLRCYFSAILIICLSHILRLPKLGYVNSTAWECESQSMGT